MRCKMGSMVFKIQGQDALSPRHNGRRRREGYGLFYLSQLARQTVNEKSGIFGGAGKLGAYILIDGNTAHISYCEKLSKEQNEN